MMRYFDYDGGYGHMFGDGGMGLFMSVVLALVIVNGILLALWLWKQISKK